MASVIASVAIYIDGGTEYQRYGGKVEYIDFSYSKKIDKKNVF